MFNQKMKHKKAQIGTMLTLMVATIVILFILIIFFFLSNALFSFKFRKSNSPIKIITMDNAAISLKSFLNSQYEIEINGDKEPITMADLIRLHYFDMETKGIISYNIEYSNRIKEEAEKTFAIFGEDKCYHFSISETGIEAGNPELFFKDAYTFKLSVSYEKAIEIKLIIDDECLEEQNRNE